MTADRDADGPRYRIVWREPTIGHGGSRRLRHRSVECPDRAGVERVIDGTKAFLGEFRIVDIKMQASSIASASAVRTWVGDGAHRLPVPLPEPQWSEDNRRQAAWAGAARDLRAAVVRGTEVGLYDDASAAAIMAEFERAVQSSQSVVGTVGPF